MRVRLLGLWLPLVFACSGTNVVAGPELTEAERLEASVPTWCATSCNRLQACEGSDCSCEGEGCSCTVVDNCPHECQANLTSIIHTSAACAEIASRLTRCYEGSGCGVFDGACAGIEDETAQHCDVSSSSGENDPDPPSPAYGGSTSAGPPPAGEGGSPSYGGSLLTCEGAISGGPSGPVPSTTGVICEQGRFDCSDGSDYSMVCVATSAGQRACSCLVDEVVTGAFGPGEACPTLAEMNAGCGWRLADM